jgi:acetylornithine/N-succinyldiaminopimelate aminotransferase
MSDSGFFMDTYKRTPLVFTRGSGSRLYDADGRSWVDFTSGIGVNILGHGDPELVAAIAAQAGKMIHVSNYYQSDTALALAAELCHATGYERVFFGNSGAEANEGAIKIARKYGQARSAAKNVVVTLRGSFHGRTIATLTATGQDKFHVNFGPFPAGFRYVQPGNLAELDEALDSDTTCAFMFEPIQGESGVVPLDQNFVAEAARLCQERNILLIADEVQAGMGRSGKFFAFEHFGIQPDLVTVAKGLGGGVPVGAVLARGAAASVFVPGDHGSTFGGNPLSTAAARVVIARLGSPGFLDAVAARGERIAQGVRSWNHPLVKLVRGKGLMIGIAVTCKPADVLAACLASGLLVLTAGDDTVRLLPPLVITDEEIDAGLAILRAALDGIMAREAAAAADPALVEG